MSEGQAGNRQARSLTSLITEYLSHNRSRPLTSVESLSDDAETQSQFTVKPAFVTTEQTHQCRFYQVYAIYTAMSATTLMFVTSLTVTVTEPLRVYTIP